MKKIVKYPLTLLALTFHKSGRALMSIGKIFYRLIEERPVDIHTFHPDWDDYASKKEIEEKKKKEEDHELAQKYSEWQKVAETNARMQTIRSMFEDMNQHQLEYFGEQCISEFEENPYTIMYVAKIVSELHNSLQAAEIEVELQMHCETNQVFGFIFNHIFGAVCKDTFPSFAAKTFRYENGLNEEFMEGYYYETKRRFAEALEAELEKHDKPAPKRVKI